MACVLDLLFFKGKVTQSYHSQEILTGACHGTFRNKHYFKCGPTSTVFVGLDDLMNHWKITVIQKRDSGIPSFFKGKSDPKLSQPRNIDSLKINQRVVTFGDEDIPLRGTVRYTGDVEDSRRDVQTLVGLELVSSPQSHGFSADFFLFLLFLHHFRFHLRISCQFCLKMISTN